MLMAMPLPALRNLDMMPIEQDGETLLCLQDREGIVEDPIVLSPVAFFVASMLDGTNEVADIQYAFAQHARRTLLTSEDIMNVVSFLDQHGFLDSEEYASRRKNVLEAFERADARPAYMAGRSYPPHSKELAAFLESLGESRQQERSATAPPLRGLVAPHIDFQRGGSVYAAAYGSLRAQDTPRTAFIFGVAHAGGTTPFILTKKSFATPFGTLETDKRIVEYLAGACRWNPYEEEILHRNEHSIEFQTTMLAHACGPSVRIVPILCGAFGSEEEMKSPDEMEHVEAFLARCREVVSDEAGNAIAIAGADLAHVGRRFGDPFDINDAIIQDVERRDREDLAFAVRGDACAFYRSVMSDGNARRVCGLGCIYATLKTLEGSVKTGSLLKYAYAPDPAGGIVSFAGIALM